MALVDQVLHVMTPAEWGKPIDVDDKWIEFVDENVKAGTCRIITGHVDADGHLSAHEVTLLTRVINVALPPGSVVEDIVPHGASYWTRTAEISTRAQDGSPRSYFLKVSYYSSQHRHRLLPEALSIS